MQRGATMRADVDRRSAFRELGAIVLALLAAPTVLSPAQAQTVVSPMDQSPADCFSDCGPSPDFISVQDSGIYFGLVGRPGQRVTDAVLVALLREQHRKTPDRGLLIRADASVSYGEFYRVYRLAEAAGFRGQIRILNEELE